jgi:hypothetical protein
MLNREAKEGNGVGHSNGLLNYEGLRTSLLVGRTHILVDLLTKLVKQMDSTSKYMPQG